MISSICDGANPLSWLFTRTMEFKVVGTVIMVAIALGLAIYNRKRIMNQNSEN